MSTNKTRKFFELKDTKAVDVFLEGRKSKTYVGRLTRETTNYIFKYDEKYFKSKKALPFGPEFPLTKRSFTSSKLFVPFSDRIPSRDNPAYSEYCEKFDISPNEKDPFILLVTIASHGPSSFVFEPVFEDHFSGEDSKKFRRGLGLTLRDFATAFDISLATVVRIEDGTSTGRDILKRIEIYAKFPLIARYEVEKNSSMLHENIRSHLFKRLS